LISIKVISFHEKKLFQSRFEKTEECVQLFFCAMNFASLSVSILKILEIDPPALFTLTNHKIFAPILCIAPPMNEKVKYLRERLKKTQDVKQHRSFTVFLIISCHEQNNNEKNSFLTRK